MKVQGPTDAFIKKVQFLTVTHMSATMGRSLAAGGGSAVLPVTVTLPSQGFEAV